MSDVNVLVVFYSRYGDSEKLALAAGVGAVQARANIRLRRLRDLADAETIAADARWQRNLERMTMDYIAPREIDAAWADVFILSAPEDATAEMQEYLRSLSGVAGKIAAPLSGEPIAAAAAQAGFTVVPREAGASDAVASCRLHGKHVAEHARSLKTA